MQRLTAFIVLMLVFYPNFIAAQYNVTAQLFLEVITCIAQNK